MAKKVYINLDKKREIKFTLNSMIEFEKLTGKSMTSLGDIKDMGTILALIYSGLIHEDKELTMEQLGDLITLDKLGEINVAISNAISVVK